MLDKQKEKKNNETCDLPPGASIKDQSESRRKELLENLRVQEFFKEGSIRIDMKTCKGVECRYCIEVCPTNALYWRAGEVVVIEDLCVYCTSCVLNCMVPNCIEVRRKRETGEIERFSNPTEALKVLERLNTERRTHALHELFPDEETRQKETKSSK